MKSSTYPRSLRWKSTDTELPLGDTRSADHNTDLTSMRLMVELVRKIKSRKDGPTFLAESIVDSSYYVRPDDSPKSDARCDPVVFEAHILERVEHLAGIDKGRDLEVRYDPGKTRP